MRGCWKGPISPLHADMGNSGRRRFFGFVVRVVEPSISPTMVPCFSFFESVPGVVGVKKFMVTPESNILNTVFWTVVLEMSSLHLNVKLFNVCSGHWNRQRPTSARCFSDPPMILVRVACSLCSGQQRDGGHVWLVCHSATSKPHEEQ